MVSRQVEIDEQLSPLLDRKCQELDPVENAILHLGAYELLHQADIPCKVVINESVELAKMFGAEESHKYINGILDRLAHLCRQGELSNA
jgi:N utilization substance protein B